MRVTELDRVHRPRHEQLGVEAQRLLPSLPTELVTGESGRESEIVLDARRRAGLPSARDALDEQCAQSFGGAIHRGREPRGSTADDDDVVRIAARGGLQTDRLREIGHRWSLEATAI